MPFLYEWKQNCSELELVSLGLFPTIVSFAPITLTNTTIKLTFFLKNIPFFICHPRLLISSFGNKHQLASPVNTFRIQSVCPLKYYFVLVYAEHHQINTWNDTLCWDYNPTFVTPFIPYTVLPFCI